MPKFDWSALPAEPKEAPAQTGGGFDWGKFQAEGESPAAAAPRGVQDYEQPAGPEQAGAFDRLKERVTDPQRLQAIVLGTGPYARKDLVQGEVPLVMPGGAIPKLTRAAMALSEGKGLAAALGRTALATGQGAIMSGLSGGQEGESWQDKIDRVKSGAKLSGGIQAAAEAIPLVGKGLGIIARKASSSLSGVPEDLIKNYSARTDEVNDLIKSSGGDITTAADKVRTELSDGIQKAKKALNSTISQTLAKASPEASVDVTPIIQKLEAAKSGLNPNFKAGAISEIDDMVQAIKKEAGEGGKVSPQSLYQIKQFLNEGASSAYNKGGQIFTRASEAARAAKDAAGDARQMVREAAPDIAEADAQLSRLHGVESRLNKNLLAPGKPDGALLAAGAGGNPRNAANLRALEQISGVPVMQRAQDLATAREFAKPDLVSSMKNGRALLPAAISAGAGAALGPLGYLAGAVASPMGIKAGVNVANTLSTAANRLPGVASVIRNNPVASQAAVQLAAKQIREANPRGEPAFIEQGAQKLGMAPEDKERVSRSPAGKKLLIEASYLPSDSPRLRRIKEQLSRMGE